MIDTVKAHCKRRRCHLCREIEGHKYSIFTMVVFVPCRLVPVGIKPFTYGRQHGKKLSGAYLDRDAVHKSPNQSFLDVNTLVAATKAKKRLTLISGNFSLT